MLYKDKPKEMTPKFLTPEQREQILSIIKKISIVTDSKLSDTYEDEKIRLLHDPTRGIFKVSILHNKLPEPMTVLLFRTFSFLPIESGHCHTFHPGKWIDYLDMLAKHQEQILIERRKESFTPIDDSEFFKE